MRILLIFCLTLHACTFSQEKYNLDGEWQGHLNFVFEEMIDNDSANTLEAQLGSKIRFEEVVLDSIRFTFSGEQVWIYGYADTVVQLIKTQNEKKPDEFMLSGDNTFIMFKIVNFATDSIILEENPKPFVLAKNLKLVNSHIKLRKIK
jgi:hypothetical protein